MNRELKNLLYEQVARIGKALSSPKRLEMIEMLAQGERTVEVLARDVAIDIKLASAHLRVLKESRLVVARREGRFIVCRLAGADIAALWANVHTVATEHLVELQVALGTLVSGAERLSRETRLTLLRKAAQGEVIVLDVRPEAEYRAGHLPHARSIPLPELKRRLAELPKTKEIVAYCRGPFCLMSAEAVALLKRHGYRTRKISDGVAEWTAAGLSVDSEA